MEHIYLDNSATTRPYDDVVSLVAKVQAEAYGNPSSLHQMGVEAERLLNEARASLAAVLGGRADEIYFTSGGTEAINLALRGAVSRQKRRGRHIITSSIEHPSTLNCCRQLEQEGFTVSYLTADREGYVSLERLRQEVGAETILVSLIHANNEIGTVQPVEQVGALVKKINPNTLFHIDAVQSFAKIPLNIRRCPADLVSSSAHKIHGPKGVGALWVRKNTLLQPLMYGGDQEGGLRPGTENTAGIAGFGLAARLTAPQLTENAARMTGLKRQLYRDLRDSGLAVTLNGPALEAGAPHIINLSFPGIKAEILLHALEGQGIYISAGSACHSRHPEPSHVLQAIGLSEERLNGALRFSFSAFNREAEIEFTVKTIGRLMKEFGPIAG